MNYWPVIREIYEKLFIYLVTICLVTLYVRRLYKYNTVSSISHIQTVNVDTKGHHQLGLESNNTSTLVKELCKIQETFTQENLVNMKRRESFSNMEELSAKQQKMFLEKVDALDQHHHIEPYPWMVSVYQSPILMNASLRYMDAMNQLKEIARPSMVHRKQEVEKRKMNVNLNYCNSSPSSIKCQTKVQKGTTCIQQTPTVYFPLQTVHRNGKTSTMVKQVLQKGWLKKSTCIIPEKTSSSNNDEEWCEVVGRKKRKNKRLKTNHEPLQQSSTILPPSPSPSSSSLSSSISSLSNVDQTNIKGKEQKIQDHRHAGTLPQVESSFISSSTSAAACRTLGGCISKQDRGIYKVLPPTVRDYRQIQTLKEHCLAAKVKLNYQLDYEYTEKCVDEIVKSGDIEDDYDDLIGEFTTYGENPIRQLKHLIPTALVALEDKNVAVEERQEQARAYYEEIQNHSPFESGGVLVCPYGSHRFFHPHVQGIRWMWEIDEHPKDKLTSWELMSVAGYIQTKPAWAGHVEKLDSVLVKYHAVKRESRTRAASLEKRRY